MVRSASDGLAASLLPDVFESAGIPVTDGLSSGYRYRQWLHRSGGGYVLPGGGDSRNAGALKTFGRAFPALRSPLWQPRRLKEHCKLFLERASVNEVALTLNDSPDRLLPGFHVAVPGAYRKLTVADTGRDGSVRVFGKLAAHPRSEARILHEGTVLRLLSEMPAIRGRVPRLEGLAEFHGRPLLLVSPGPVQPGASRFGRSVTDFLSRLHAGSRSVGTIQESGTVRRWRRSIDSLAAGRGGVRFELLSAAIDRLEKRLGGLELPLSLAHGDFTPANTRTGQDGLFVFDWETAFEPALPGHDAFHFVSLPNALRRRKLRCPASVASWIAESCPEASRHIDELWLSYLLETGLQYAQARELAPEEGDDKVLNAVLVAMARELAKTKRA
jgi:hypothetical protein